LETTADGFPSSSSSNASFGQSYAVANALAEAEIASEIYSPPAITICWSNLRSTTTPTSGHFRQREGAGNSRASTDTQHHLTFKAFGTG